MKPGFAAIFALLTAFVTPWVAVAATTVEQGGQRAEDIRANLRNIAMPEGFSIELYALVPNARHMAVGPSGEITFVGTRTGEIWAVIDRDGDHVADEVRSFAPDIAKTVPNGVCFTPGGDLVSVERNRIRLYPDAEAAVDATVQAVDIVAEGDLIPASEEARAHSARVCRVGPDGMLYVSLGQPYNVTPPDKVDLYDRLGIGGIVRMSLDGSGREVFTRGVRNSVGHDFNPETGELWFTDNQVDRMGDDIPPGEINRQTAPGQHFGFPWYGGGSVRTREYANDTPPPDVVFPVSETVAHAADLGMIFYRGDQFPERYRNAIFSAQHGSWNRSTPVGARVMVSVIDAAGLVTTEPFAEGWLFRGRYLGRPVDVAELPDGSLLVSDDHAGALYRISYGE